MNVESLIVPKELAIIHNEASGIGGAMVVDASNSKAVGSAIEKLTSLQWDSENYDLWSFVPTVYTVPNEITSITILENIRPYQNNKNFTEIQCLLGFEGFEIVANIEIYSLLKLMSTCLVDKCKINGSFKIGKSNGLSMVLPGDVVIKPKKDKPTRTRKFIPGVSYWDRDNTYTFVCMGYLGYWFNRVYAREGNYSGFRAQKICNEYPVLAPIQMVDKYIDNNKNLTTVEDLVQAIFNLDNLVKSSAEDAKNLINNGIQGYRVMMNIGEKVLANKSDLTSDWNTGLDNLVDYIIENKEIPYTKQGIFIPGLRAYDEKHSDEVTRPSFSGERAQELQKLCEPLTIDYNIDMTEYNFITQLAQNN